MEAPASHFRGGLVRGTVLPLRCPQSMSLTFWSVGGAQLSFIVVASHSRDKANRLSWL